KHSNRSILEILLKSEDFIEFASRLKLMTILVSEDAAVLNEINDKKEANITIKKSIIDLRKKQTKIKEEIEKLVNQSEKKQREIEGIYDKKSNLLAKTRSDKNALLAIMKDFEIKESEINRVLESYKYGSVPGSKFLWPIAGRKGSGFGWRIHPILGYKRFHSGIDFPAPSRSPINSAEGGEVISAGYDSGYGYSVMVYNGGGVATVYAHLSQILVAVGQRVERGQVIGLVGSTGWATGPNLHFEVRKDGIAQNPSDWLQ
ncbi:MAG: M23 family metallopeptidase, partial [Actinobacteria bacterium]|nr:M23 family metallopeptidase [Actinomycetota bacterium]